ncbi:MAG: GTP 3',8-cyclase MoaA [Desulfobacterales bacterium]|nr:GTP 3',8-cyclase MoaA [Desulfobacterales bacterium]
METEKLYDSFGRRVRSLRISLTELCNFRCIYCTTSSISILPSSHYLTRYEIHRFVCIANKLGIEKVRLTGGEPMLREDIVEIVQSVKTTGTQEVSITTNGSRLAPMLSALKKAGLDRINISLDSMNAERFREVTLVHAFREVMQSVFLALKAGFPVKLNMVALKGLTRDEILEFVGLARDWPLDVRFLEFMPLCGEAWRPDLVFPIGEIRSIVQDHFQLEEIPRDDAPAQTFRLISGKGRVGFIGSLTESFCDQCSRIRLTADGNIRPCLFSGTQVPIKALLRENAPDAAIAAAIREAVRIKPAGNAFRNQSFDSSEETLRGAGPAIRKTGG